MKDWDINIYRGILTGYNEAFIIDGKKKQEILDNCKTPEEREKTDELIRPILRGRDIKRYGYDFADLWLINTHNGIKEKDIPPIEIEDYPAIKNHLDQYYSSLEKRADKGDTPYNLRNCAYMEDFSKQKIIYPNMTKFLPFVLDKNKMFPNPKCYVVTGKHIEFLTAFFNSSLFKYCFRENFPMLQDDTRELQKRCFETIPVIPINDKVNQIFSDKITEVQALKNKDINTKNLEIEIDNLIFDLYNLTEYEKNIIGFIEIQ